MKGKNVLIVCRSIPEDKIPKEKVEGADIVVHVTHAHGINSVPRCDHLVTLGDVHALSVTKELKPQVKNSRLFILRQVIPADVLRYQRQYGVEGKKILSIFNDDRTLTTGLWATMLYLKLGANVHLFGVSRPEEREKLFGNRVHGPGLSFEADILRFLDASGSVTWLEC